MAEKAPAQPNRRRALRVLIAIAATLISVHLLIPALISRSINHHLASNGIQMDASIRVALPGLITLTNVKLLGSTPENRISIDQVSVSLRPSAILNDHPDRKLSHVALLGIRGSWTLPKTTPDGAVAQSTDSLLPRHVPDSIEISVADLHLSLPSTQNTPIRQLVIDDLSLTASTTHEGEFHIGRLKAGDTEVLDNVNGETTFFGKQLSIKELRISTSDVIEHLKLDPGTTSGRPSVDFLLLRGNGYISAKGVISETGGGQTLSLRTDAENVTLPVDPFASTSQTRLPIIDIQEIHATFDGRLDRPSSWRAKASVSGAIMPLDQPEKRTTLIAGIDISDHSLNLQTLSIEDPAISITASAKASLEDAASLRQSITQLSSDTSLSFTASENASPLRQLAEHFGAPIPRWLPSTRVTARLSQSEDASLTIKADFTLSQGGDDEPGSSVKGSLTWDATSLANPGTGTLNADVKPFNIRFKNTPLSIPATSIWITSNPPDHQVSVKLNLPGKTVSLLTKQGATAPWKLGLEHLPLSEILPNLPPTNPCTLSLDGTLTPARPDHPILSGSLRLDDPSTAVRIETHLNQTEESTPKITSSIFDHDSKVASAEVELAENPSKPITSLRTSGDIANAYAFRNILVINDLFPSANARVSWKAEATLDPQHPIPVGELSCEIIGISTRTVGPVELRSTLGSDGSSLRATNTLISIGETSASGTISWSKTLDMRDLRILQRGRPALRGELSIQHPLDSSLSPATDAPLSASLEAEQLDLATLLGERSPVTGKVQGKMTLTGSLDHPVIGGRLSSSKLNLPGPLEPFNPLAIDILAHPTPGSISLTAKITSALGAPIELTYLGSIRPWLPSRTPPPDSPQDTLTATLKGGSLQPLNKFDSIFKSVSGNIDFNLVANRSNGRWNWNGKSLLKAPKLLFESPRAPGLSDLAIHAVIKDSDTATVDLATSSGGGTIRIRGDIRTPLSGDPLLDLSIQTRNVLAYRNQSLLLRADSDLTLKGSWSHASVEGEASPVQSKYLHDIEILPIGLTRKGETRSQLKGLSPGFSFAQRPYADWKFNIHFKSRPRDPLQIRGNRWQGDADVDMLWGGTGLRPWFEGYYHSKNLTAFLPSVRLSVTDGYLHYRRDTPFQGNLDVNALTTARGYRISAYISGSLSQPDLLLTSKPALDQTDILSLLTTGVLPSDPNDSPQVFAARATEAIAEDLSRSLFGVDRRTIEKMGRVDVEFSRVNPRTGQQETRVTRRLSEDWSVSGDIGTNGDFTGRLKFLHRFK